MGGRRHTKDLLLLLLSAVVTLALMTFPLGRVVLWPFLLLATWCHEAGHGIVAALFGELETIAVMPDASGLTHFDGVGTGIPAALTALGGLLGPPVAAGALILIGVRPKLTTISLYVLGGAAFATMILFGSSSLGMWYVAAIGIAIIFAARRTSPAAQRLLIHFLAVQMLVHVYLGMGYVFRASATVAGQLLQSDIAIVAKNLWLPPLFWGGFVATLSVGIPVACLWATYGARRAKS